MRRLVTGLLTLALSATFAPPASAGESVMAFTSFSGPATPDGVLGEYSVTADPVSTDAVVSVSRLLGPGRKITVQWVGLHAHVNASAIVTLFAGNDKFSSPRLGVSGPTTDAPIHQLTVTTTGNGLQARQIGVRLHPQRNNVGGSSAIKIVSLVIE